MKKTRKFLCWSLIVLLALVVITDALCALGLPRGWQYAYNAFFFLLALPGLLAGALRDKEAKMEVGDGD